MQRSPVCVLFALVFPPGRGFRFSYAMGTRPPTLGLKISKAAGPSYVATVDLLGESVVPGDELSCSSQGRRFGDAVGISQVDSPTIAMSLQAGFLEDLEVTSRDFTRPPKLGAGRIEVILHRVQGQLGEANRFRFRRNDSSRLAGGSSRGLGITVTTIAGLKFGALSTADLDRALN